MLCCKQYIIDQKISFTNRGIVVDRHPNANGLAARRKMMNTCTNYNFILDQIDVLSKLMPPPSIVVNRSIKRNVTHSIGLYIELEK